MLKFLDYVSKLLWNNNVTAPTTVEEARHNQVLFEMTGFTRCIGSVDGTLVGLECCTNCTTHNHNV